jgi:hypothetical protein
LFTFRRGLYPTFGSGEIGFIAVLTDSGLIRIMNAFFGVITKGFSIGILLSPLLWNHLENCGVISEELFRIIASFFHHAGIFQVISQK